MVEFQQNVVFHQWDIATLNELIFYASNSGDMGAQQGFPGIQVRRWNVNAGGHTSIVAQDSCIHNDDLLM